VRFRLRHRLARAAAAAIALLALGAAWFLLVPAGGDDLIFVEVASGTPIRRIAAQLKGAGVVRSSLVFHVLARLSGRPLQAGEYGFRRVRMIDVLRALQEGRVHLHSFLVPEGESTYQIAAALERAGLADAAGFLLAVSDRKLLKSLRVRARRAEGYLFPDTYRFPRGMAPERIVEVMVTRFFEKVSDDLIARAGKRDFSLHRLVTFASIVEKEARVPEERPVIAAVFHNRLKLGMRLQADPTVLYGLRRWDDRLSRKDLRADTPYNTYRRHGLPPGPICSPGLSCLEASAAPVKVKFLYFVTRKDGTNRHVFTTTLAAHQAAVRRSKREARERQGGSGKRDVK